MEIKNFLTNLPNHIVSVFQLLTDCFIAFYASSLCMIAVCVVTLTSIIWLPLYHYIKKHKKGCKK